MNEMNHTWADVFKLLWRIASFVVRSWIAWGAWKLVRALDKPARWLVSFLPSETAHNVTIWVLARIPTRPTMGDWR